MIPVSLLAPAQRELDEAVAYYEAQVAGLGDAFLLEALRVIDLISIYPDAWHPLSADIRRCRLSRFPYGVVYMQEPEGIIVLAVMHLHRKPEYWRGRAGD
ncbi:MAG: type II toxin-antitoxin system RelE/ParE family toxin [Burkholderiales bacterium]